MRFLSFETRAGASWGVATDAGIVDIGARQGGSLLETLQVTRMFQLSKYHPPAHRVVTSEVVAVANR